MIKFKYNNCTKCGCELNKDTRYIQCSHKGTVKEKISSSQLCINHRMELNAECRRIKRKNIINNDLIKTPSLRDKERSKFCSECKAPLTEENTKYLKYTTSNGEKKQSKVGKCRKCLNNYKLDYSAKKNVVKKNVVKKNVVKINKLKKEIKVSEIVTSPRSTKEKMEEIFKEQHRRELETKAKGTDAQMVNPIFRMGDE
tara:strand:+ start:8839 stop:9435 length:597 start_codon:yes stop_codon:yes gene_type:complete